MKSIETELELILNETKQTDLQPATFVFIKFRGIIILTLSIEDVETVLNLNALSRTLAYSRCTREDKINMERNLIILEVI